MMKTREQIQFEALEAIKRNNYNGCVVLSPGTGKSKVSIDCIKEGNFKNILITSPRTNLKESWIKELNKWGFDWGTGNFENICIETIQTCYKWSEKSLKQFDFIIIDEVHTLGNEYFALVENAQRFNINGDIHQKAPVPILGLTGTPTKSDLWKKEVLYKTLPIVYEYYDAEEDGITNSIKYWIFEYNLTNDFKVQVGTKTKKWLAGELTQYNYLSEQYEKAKNRMFELGASEYFETSLMWMKGKNLVHAPNNIDGILGEKEIDATKEQKEAGRKFFFAVRNRKEFLWNLTSSRLIALKFKENILNKKYYDEELYCIQNKVLLFSELTEQANKLSKYALHSNNGDTPKQIEENNKKLLDDFNNGIIRELSSVNSLSLGLNMVGANWAIFESYSSSNTNAIQKCKRLVRLEKDEIANVVIILPKNTQAETWFREAFKGIEYQIINKINDLKI